MIFKKNRRGYSVIGLYRPNKNVNIGGVMRAASCYDVSSVVVQGEFQESHEDTTRGYKHIPVTTTHDLLSCIPYKCTPIAIEFITTATNIINFTWPERRFLIFGPENSSIPDQILKVCKHILYIPTNFCMNLAATSNVVLYDIMQKEMRK